MLTKNIKFKVVKTRSEPTVKVVLENEVDSFYLHSKYDPIREASIWINGIGSNKKEQIKLVVVGMGAGYHIRQLLKSTNVQEITIFEFNEEYYNWIRNSTLIMDLLSNKKVTYKLVKDKIGFENFIQFLNKNIIIYQPSLKVIPSKYKELKEKIENFIIQERTAFSDNFQFHDNFEKNILLMDSGLNAFKRPRQSSMILVSAGPSLTKHLPLLKKAYLSCEYIIGAVGTAFIPLMDYGIVPNFVMISDPNQEIVEQFQNFSTEKTTLFYLSTANHQAVNNFKGFRYIVWQEGFDLAERQAFEKNEPLIKTGGSVATCLLDLMIYLGAQRIALVGQDLAFTDQKSHAEKTHDQRKIKSTELLREVPDYFQKGTVYTSKNLSVYLDWFKQYVDDKNDIEFWNCTEGGAFINGWIHKPLIKFLGTE